MKVLGIDNVFTRVGDLGKAEAFLRQASPGRARPAAPGRTCR